MIKLITHTDLDGIGCAILAKIAFRDNVEIEYCNNPSLPGNLFPIYGNYRVFLDLEGNGRSFYAVYFNASFAQKSPDFLSGELSGLSNNLI